MLGDFTYSNPTKIYFGENSLDNLSTELKNYGKNVLLVYGGGSIKKNGIYDKVIDILKKCDKTIIEDAGVMPNPTVEKLYEGCKLAREGNVDFLLLVAEVFVTMLKQYQFQHIAMKTHGKNIIYVWKTLTIKLFL